MHGGAVGMEVGNIKSGPTGSFGREGLMLQDIPHPREPKKNITEDPLKKCKK